MVSDRARSSGMAEWAAGTLGLLGIAGETDADVSELGVKPGCSWPSDGGGIKTVFLTSRRPRIVPAFRLMPACWACCNNVSRDPGQSGSRHSPF